MVLQSVCVCVCVCVCVRECVCILYHLPLDFHTPLGLWQSRNHPILQMNWRGSERIITTPKGTEFALQIYIHHLGLGLVSLVATKNGLLPG